MRDENRGTYVPSLSKLAVDQWSDGFSVSYRATRERGGRRLVCEAQVDSRSGGSLTSLTFSASATPATDFVTCLTGFVVWSPLQGVSGQAVTVEHVDGTLQASTFPTLVDPVQP